MKRLALFGMAATLLLPPLAASAGAAGETAGDPSAATAGQTPAPAEVAIHVSGDRKPPPALRYPALPETVDDVAAILPEGWRVETKLSGDLNRDGAADRVLVLHATDPARLVEDKASGRPPLDTNPRMLAVYFALKTGGFRRAAQDHSLIPRVVDWQLSDPLGDEVNGGVAVTGGTLRIRLGLFASAGGWDLGTSSYTFRWQDNAFALIGFDRDTVNRGSGKTLTRSYNYLIRREQIVSGDIASDETKTRWRDLPDHPLLVLGQIADGLAFDPDGPPPLPSQADDRGWNWADSPDADFDDGSQTQAICDSLRDREPPESDRPSPQQAKALEGCDAAGLYYGIGREADPVAAVKCAFVQTDRTDDTADPLSGTGLLMTLYANGAGVARDLDLATSLACRVRGAPFANAGRIRHLQQMKQAPQLGVFDYCDDVTSSWATGICAARDASRADAARQTRVATLTSGWTQAERRLLDPLRDAAEAYVTASSENEVDLSGTLRATFMIDRQQGLRDAFAALLEQMEKGDYPTASGQQAKTADSELNAVYAKIMAVRTAPDARGTYGSADSLPYSTVTHAGIRKTERIWIAYRDAWRDFAAGRYPGAGPAGLMTFLTKARTADLEALIPDD
ncbi:lysozyme inhibitor LprI family protein [Rhizobium halophytocola]|uniref:Uncharacterized protein YecT (DUF1311 family) n=1 Tax=Rhizobium halophytocola TaxID=735519 RepID=A0ABS4E1T0_9HYPH|nr:lysozyme inhibitor LprI family protein [Rhizobium halophytocola]MBP1851903.1 uncharacterized protein YecT (DUF1311 family) [Rhizobium halophytocola]